MSPFTCRLAQMDDVPALRVLMRGAIDALQRDFLTPEQIRASHQVMGLDTQLVRDQTYFLVECEGAVAGCGGWSYRATLFGGDDSIVARAPLRLDPATDAAPIRAMYTDPAFARRGVGSLVLRYCEAAASAHGFRRARMMATLAGVPLYEACGYRHVAARASPAIDGVVVPLVEMEKQIDPCA
jgi:GNAT superfamily N-acetyltransferase